MAIAVGWADKIQFLPFKLNNPSIGWFTIPSNLLLIYGSNEFIEITAPCYVPINAYDYFLVSFKIKLVGKAFNEIFWYVCI